MSSNESLPGSWGLRRKPAGIVVEMVRFVKAGRLSQFAEPLSEAAQLLESQGWKSAGIPIQFVEGEQTHER